MLNPLNFIRKFIKSTNEKELIRLNKVLDQVNSHEEKAINLKDEDFPKKTLENPSMFLKLS